MSLKQNLTLLTHKVPGKWRGNKSLVWDWEKKETKRQKNPNPGGTVFSEGKWNAPGVMSPKARASCFRVKIWLTGWFPSFPASPWLPAHSPISSWVTPWGFGINSTQGSYPATMAPLPQSSTPHRRPLLVWLAHELQYSGIRFKSLRVVKGSWTREHLHWPWRNLSSWVLSTSWNCASFVKASARH